MERTESGSAHEPVRRRASLRRWGSLSLYAAFAAMMLLCGSAFTSKLIGLDGFVLGAVIAFLLAVAGLVLGAISLTRREGWHAAPGLALSLIPVVLVTVMVVWFVNLVK